MSINAKEMLSRARGAVGSEYRQSGCLEWVYAMAGRPRTGLPEGSFPTARAAKYRTLGALNKDASKAPAGAIHYWDGDPGHVAIGTGGARAISTNAAQRVSSTRSGVRYALIGERSIAELSQGRGAYAGWAANVFNQQLDGLVYPQPSHPASGGGRVIRRGVQGDDVRRLQVFLEGSFPAYAKGKTGKDGVYGNGTAGVVGEFQRRTGNRDDGWFTWGSGPTWDALVKHGFRG